MENKIIELNKRIVFLEKEIRMLRNHCGCNAGGMCGCKWDVETMDWISDYEREENRKQKRKKPEKLSEWEINQRKIEHAFWNEGKIK